LLLSIFAVPQCSHKLGGIPRVYKRIRIVLSEHEPYLPILQLHLLLGIVEVPEPHERHTLLLAHVEDPCGPAPVRVPVPPDIYVLLLEHPLDYLRVKLYFSPVLEGGLEFIVEYTPENLLNRDVFVKGLEWEV
jgi:hypothetical protein